MRICRDRKETSSSTVTKDAIATCGEKAGEQKAMDGLKMLNDKPSRVAYLAVQADLHASSGHPTTVVKFAMALPEATG